MVGGTSDGYFPAKLIIDMQRKRSSESSPGVLGTIVLETLTINNKGVIVPASETIGDSTVGDDWHEDIREYTIPIFYDPNTRRCHCVFLLYDGKYALTINKELSFTVDSNNELSVNKCVVTNTNYYYCKILGYHLDYIKDSENPVIELTLN